MRHYKTLALCAAMLAMPAVTTAQTNIRKAFDKFVNSKDVSVGARHELTKDPDTGLKEGLYDIYTYTIPKSKAAMLKEVEDAFERDKEEAYSYGSGVNSDGKSGISLAVGTDAYNLVAVATAKGAFYVYSCFNDPDDAERKYRYAYSMDRLEQGDSLTGRLVITYATSMKYRNKQYSFGPQWNDDNDDSSSWLGEFNIYSKKLKEDPNSNAASIYVNNIYNLSKRAGSLTTVEKNLIITEIMNIKRKVSDDFMKVLLNSAIERLKE